MGKVAVVYWSGTGNTQAMAEAVLAGAKEGGAEAVLLAASEFDAAMMDGYDAVAFGCPAMGAEVLEEGEFQPMFDSVEGKLGEKRLVCSAHMGGETAGGCEAGRRPAGRREQSLCATA